MFGLRSPPRGGVDVERHPYDASRTGRRISIAFRLLVAQSRAALTVGSLGEPVCVERVLAHSYHLQSVIQTYCGDRLRTYDIRCVETRFLLVAPLSRCC